MSICYGSVSVQQPHMCKSCPSVPTERTNIRKSTDKDSQ